MVDSIQLATTNPTTPPALLLDKDKVRGSINLVLSSDGKKKPGSPPPSDLSRINEDQFFAALTHYKLAEKKPSLADKFAKGLPAMIKTVQTVTSNNVFFKATKRLLRQLRINGDVTREETKEIRKFALGKSQLDSNRTEVSEKRISDKDDDTPLRAIKTALEKVDKNEIATDAELESFKAINAVKHQEDIKEARRTKRNQPTELGTENPESTSTEIPPGFLWKPESDSDGKLAILLPPGLTGNITSVQILSPDSSSLLADGKYSGVGNGDREHYRFPKSGGSYPPRSVVVVALNDGSNLEIKIPDTSIRVE